jgi:beta-lactamase class A
VSQARIAAAFADAGIEGWLHAVDVDDPGREIGLRPDEAVVLSSVFKLPLLVELWRQIEAGRIAATAPVDLPAVARTAGPTGIATMRDDVRLSVRDLAQLMIAVSDNAAADALFDLVGEDAVNARLDALGLPATRVVGCCRDLFAAMEEDAGTDDREALATRLADPAVRARLRVLDPARTSRSTPREMTALLGAVWTDAAGPPAACAEVRRALGLQVWPHRLASGFPSDDVRVSGKTGTLPGVRNEVGVVELPSGARYAVAVFTRTDSPAFVLPQADAAIGRAARVAVDALDRD